jgi:hypothetical protein
MLEIAFETFKEFLPRDVAAIGLVADAAQIAERAERVQGTGDDRLGHPQDVGQPPHRVRAGGQIDQQHQRHLPVGEIGLAGPDIIDQRVHPASQRLVRHGACSEIRVSTFRS